MLINIMGSSFYGIFIKILFVNQKKLTIIYRIAEIDPNKKKAKFISPENCLKNAVTHFPPEYVNWIIIADSITNYTENIIYNIIQNFQLIKTDLKHNSKTFRIAYDLALNFPNDTIIYLLEDDYIHRENSYPILLEAFDIPEVKYVTLYDHPDKYGEGFETNPFVQEGGENSHVYLTQSVYWKNTYSTTMTFASTVKQLKIDKEVFWSNTNSDKPLDFSIFTQLCIHQHLILISPIPGYSTHGNFYSLTPIINWEEVVKNI